MNPGMLADLLLRASVAGALAILVLGAASLLLGRAPALRCGVWWIACLKLLVGLCAVAPISLPILPAAASSPALLRIPALSAPLPARLPELPHSPWRTAIALAYLAGVGIGALLTLRQLLRTRRVLRHAQPVREPRVTNLLLELSKVSGLRRAPALRVSELVNTPQIVGFLRPTILLPRSGGARRSRVDLALTLCHELVHLKRRDLLFGWVPALASRLFFFHPGAWIAAREYALAREAACDAEVIRTLRASPRRYGRLLVESSIVRASVLAPAAAVSPSFLHLRRRLRMLDQATDPRPRGKLRWALLALLGAAVLVPLRLAARQDPASATGAAPVVVASAERHARAEQLPFDAYVLFLDESSVAMSGDMQDLDRARELRGAEDGELLWMRRGNKEYVVRDPAILKPIRELHASLAGSDEGDEATGKREEELAREQERLASEQDALNEHLEELTRERDRLEDEATGDERDELARSRERLAADELRMELEQQGREREMERLSAVLDELGAEQERRGQAAERISSRIELQIREILDEALRSGKAKRVRPAI